MYSNLQPYVPDRKPPEGCILNPYLEINQGLVLDALFNEGSGNKVFDLSGNGNTGAITGAIWVPGKYGSCLDFDGDGDYVQLPDINDSITTEGTVSIWLKLASDPPTGNPQSGLIYLNNVTNLPTHYPYNNGSIYIAILRESDRFTLADGGFNKAVWHHIAITSKPGANNWVMYRNGAQIGNATGDNTLTITNAQIGTSEDDYDFNGLIDHVMIYNRALSASEIALLYREPFCGFRWTNIIQLASYIAGEPPSGIPIFRRRRAG